MERGGVEDALQVVQHAGLVDIAELGGIQDGVVEAHLFGEALRHEAFAASGRAVQQDAVDCRQLVQLGFLGILQGKDNLLAKLFLELVAACHLVEAVAGAFLESDARGVLRDGFGRGIACLLGFLLPLPVVGSHLLHQGVEEVGGGAEPVDGPQRQGFLQDFFQEVGDMDVGGVEHKFSLSCLFDSGF